MSQINKKTSRSKSTNHPQIFLLSEIGKGNLESILFQYLENFHLFTEIQIFFNLEKLNNLVDVSSKITYKLLK